MDPIKLFLQFLIDLKKEICNLLKEKKLRVDIFHSVDYLDEWSYNEHRYFICPCGNLRKSEIKNWSVVIEVTSYEDISHCSKDMYALFAEIYEGLSYEIMQTYRMFFGENFPRVAASIFFSGESFRYFCR